MYRQGDEGFSGGAGSGAPIFNHCLEDSSFLLDYIGRGFSAIYFNDENEIDTDVLGLSQALSVGNEKCSLIIISSVPVSAPKTQVLLDSKRELFQRYAAENGSVYLVRPDRHVLGRWKKCEIHEVLQAFRQCLEGGK